MNVYGKEDTLFTIQIDFELAERFDMSYVDADGNKKDRLSYIAVQSAATKGRLRCSLKSITERSPHG